MMSARIPLGAVMMRRISPDHWKKGADVRLKMFSRRLAGVMVTEESPSLVSGGGLRVCDEFCGHVA
jgi:hypothetical protein